MLLAFDTASSTVTVALHDGTDVVASATSGQGMKHGEQLAPLIEQVLARAGAEPAALTGIAVGVGPGPFTGLRVGLVTARTMAHVLGVPVHGVCSLDVLALEAVETGAVTGAFVVASDARRKEVYLASYDARSARLDEPVVPQRLVDGDRAGAHLAARQADPVAGMVAHEQQHADVASEEVGDRHGLVLAQRCSGRRRQREDGVAHRAHALGVREDAAGDHAHAGHFAGRSVAAGCGSARRVG